MKDLHISVGYEHGRGNYIKFNLKKIGFIE